jgi:serine/threonine protein kinase
MALTAKGLVVGTADYIAPEQARGEPLDERADVYALGCTLFHLLSGRPPFRASGTEVQRYIDVMRAHVSQPVPDPRAEVAGIDEELAELVMVCMSKRRDLRPSFEELAPALARMHRRLGGELPRLTRKLFTLPTGTASIPALEPPAPGHDSAATTQPESPLALAERASSVHAMAQSLSKTNPDTLAFEGEALDEIPRHRWGWKLAVVVATAGVVAAAVMLMRR